ncbi:hypothetical protein IMY05_005G0036800 [Salix suchowensis]|nr:hypothetical protein IMY05_005G0036800 [Salix suchowensis]
MQSHSFPEYANVIITSSQEQSIKKVIGERATVQENPRPPKVNCSAVSLERNGPERVCCTNTRSFHA